MVGLCGACACMCVHVYTYHSNLTIPPSNPSSRRPMTTPTRHPIPPPPTPTHPPPILHTSIFTGPSSRPPLRRRRQVWGCGPLGLARAERGEGHPGMRVCIYVLRTYQICNMYYNQLTELIFIHTHIYKIRTCGTTTRSASSRCWTCGRRC